jgi:hypothetical protein
MKRTKRFELRLTEEEAIAFINLEKELGKSRTEIVRHRVLENTNKVLVDAKELLKQLDALGAELGRGGNNINQLARHANVLNKQGLLNSTVIIEFQEQFGCYIKSQKEIEKVLRQVIRLMSS